MKKLKKLSLENVEILSEQETMLLMGGDGRDSTLVAPRDTTSRPKPKFTPFIGGSADYTPKGPQIKFNAGVKIKTQSGQGTVSGYVNYGPGGWGGGLSGVWYLPSF